ncbi:MAG: NAD-dependent epimerase/dehydratase family protein, partial [Candidatus Omnitrophica bacterium]|nr:NAD-dependent epimerase/dehydratase family protein [Candidatus Omnitrophota bacterium]
ERTDFPEREKDLPRPISPYAVSKLTGEYYCQTFSATFALETVSLRYFNVYGPRQDPMSEYAAVVPKFILSIMNNNSPEVHGDGKQARDFTYIDNVVGANLKAAVAPGIAGGVFNVACQQQHTVMEIAQTIMDITGHNVQPEFSACRKGDVRYSLADISLVKKALGYKPQVGFEDGLRKTVEWFQKKTNRYS